MTLIWDVTLTALPFNEAHANKGWRHVQSLMLLWQKWCPQSRFQAASPVRRPWKGSAQNNPLLLLVRSVGQRSCINPNALTHTHSDKQAPKHGGKQRAVLDSGEQGNI